MLTMNIVNCSWCRMVNITCDKFGETKQQAYLFNEDYNTPLKRPAPKPAELIHCNNLSLPYYSNANVSRAVLPEPYD